ncbi:hypothetical protein [Paenibacillus nasutitermitis]|uniref:Uncharacterized protein n=1 Tax=Paenibacillus nasutitermitis TaxID=1652958 RepID=A0A916YKD9_9BACL|nr:hypothetical protein [Paenibacillus nasutitermitis]GGD49869.1 hypothetical protein GCM10010911_04270 [Paenibacillus nasutitermitis]
MSLIQKEWEARLELIRSIAGSQRAIARILDSVADISSQTPGMARSISGNLRYLTAMQLTMAETVGLLRLNRPVLGVPKRPWLQKGVFPGSGQQSGSRLTRNGRRQK